jgi:hypothetical protein
MFQGFTVIVDTNKRLTVAGTHEPAAFVELRAIGGLKGAEEGPAVVETLTKLIHKELNLPTDRFFINLVNLESDMVAHKGVLISMRR